MKAITVVMLIIASSAALGCSSVALKSAGPIGSTVEVAPVMAEAAVGAVEGFKQELDNPLVDTNPNYVQPLPQWQMHLLPVPNTRK